MIIKKYICTALILFMCSCSSAPHNMPENVSQNTAAPENAPAETVTPGNNKHLYHGEEAEKYIDHAKFESGNYWNVITAAVDDNIFTITNEGIVKKNTTSGKEEYIVKNDSVDVMQIVDNKLIYYSTNGFYEDKAKIYSVDLDGNNLKEIFDYETFSDNSVKDGSLYDLREFGLTQFYVYGDDIIMKNSTFLFKYNMITKETVREELIPCNDVNSSAFWNDKLYYTDHAFKTFSIYEKDLKTGDTAMILGDGQGKRGSDKEVVTPLYDSVYTFNNSLYYTSRVPYALYKYVPDGEDILILDTGYNKEELFYLPCVYVGADALYYLCNNELYKVENDKAVKVSDKIPDAYYTWFAAVDGVFYSSDKEDTEDNLIKAGLNIT